MDTGISKRLRAATCLTLLFGILWICHGSLSAARPRASSSSSSSSSSDKAVVLPGIDVLERMRFKPVQGKRVGLLTNPAGVNRRGMSTVEVLRRSDKVNLVALFGPEHGIYGDEKAEVPIDDRIDKRTGLPVFSLYGKYRKPTPKMLKGLDALIIDLQSVGTRSYTYISCMRLVMEACFEEGVDVVVLDRPNPLGGLKVDGPPLEKDWMSYVGYFQVPYVYGLTIGELARMSKRTPGMLNIPDDVRNRGKLIIIPMSGWKRSMLWPDTGLKWVPTSPAIQDVQAAFGYPMTGLGGQLGGFSHGYGTDWAFRLLSYRGKEASEVYQALKRRSIPGLDFKIHKYKTSGGAEKEGVYVIVKDWEKLRPTELSFHMMQLAAAWSETNPFSAAKESHQNLFNKHVGSTPWWNEITTKGSDARVRTFVDEWSKEAKKFQIKSREFYIY